MKPLFAPPPPCSLPCSDGKHEFPVNRVFCVGQNYAAHAREMGGDPDREPPFYFAKSTAAVVLAGGSISYPPGTENYHYEMELVLAIGKAGTDIEVSAASDHIIGYCCGLDMTRRDLQATAKAKGRPWTLAKDVEEGAVIGGVHLVADVGQLDRGRIWLERNGELVQEADLTQMIWSPEEIVSHLSRFYTLAPGDLIFSGTPAGVGPVVPGDSLRGGIDGLGEIEVTLHSDR